MWIVLSRMIFQVWLNKENTNGSRWPVKVVAKTHTSGKAGPNWKMSYPLNERSCTSNSDRIKSCADCCLQDNDLLTHPCLSITVLLLVSMTVNIPPERNKSIIADF